MSEVMSGICEREDLQEWPVANTPAARLMGDHEIVAEETRRGR
ncbi:MAG: hypothetical protein ACC647_05630 [Anaerolineales bacterium]